MNSFKQLFILSYSLTLSVLFAQGSLSGVVKDDQGTPLAGANVYLAGTELGSATDANGKYKIANVKPGNYTLVISYLGYNTEKFKVNVTGSLILMRP